MTRAVIYPYREELFPVVRYWNLTEDVPKIVCAVMNHSKGLTGKDVSMFCNQDPIGVTIHNDLVSALDDCDTLIISAAPECGKTDGKFNSDILEQTLRRQKNVICLHALEESKQKSLAQLSLEMDVTFTYCADRQKEEDIYYIPQKLYIPRASVVMVGEMFGGSDGSDVALRISRQMRLKGYKSAVILEQRCPILSDVFSYPAFLRETGYRESDKIYYLNNFVKHVEEESRPDIMVIHIPDSMLKYNDMFCNGFGVIPFYLSQAVKADYFVFCTQFGKWEQEFYRALSAGIEGRYGFPIDCIHMSNIMLNVQDSVQKKNLSFLRQSQDAVNKVIESCYKDSSVPIVNCFHKEESDRLCEHIIDRLSGYGNVREDVI